MIDQFGIKEVRWKINVIFWIVSRPLRCILLISFQTLTTNKTHIYEMNKWSPNLLWKRSDPRIHSKRLMQVKYFHTPSSCRHLWSVCKPAELRCAAGRMHTRWGESESEGQRRFRAQFWSAIAKCRITNWELVQTLWPCWSYEKVSG